MANYRYRFFIKFGQLEYLERMQKKGELFLNTMAYFRTLPEEQLIGDKFEGIEYLQRTGPMVLTTELNGKKIAFKTANALAYPTQKIEGNIFCLYGGNEEKLETYLNGRQGSIPIGKDFQSSPYFAFINNPREFIRRLVAYLEQAGLEYEYNPVTYIDYDTYVGVLNQFSKRIKYQGQNEFRVYVKNLINAPLKFEIGDLSDICTIGATKRHENLKFEILE